MGEFYNLLNAIFTVQQTVYKKVNFEGRTRGADVDDFKGTVTPNN
jgi:hypothetical protein